MLTLEGGIAHSNSELEVYGYCGAGFLENKDLVIYYKYVCSFDPSSDYTVEAIINKDEAVVFAKELGVHLTEIPAEINRRYDYPCDEGGAGEVEKVFQDILDSLLDIHIRYRLVRNK